ncbi:MAG: signal recognition particle protein [Oscillospiraceae bacterium]|nr:signal recognition particle protein [Oscillospiraceae bacterium]
MAFESLGEKLQETFKKLKGQGVVTEKDIKAALREVRLALLEADVSFKVVKEFEKRVFEKATGAEVMESLTPGQQIIKVVRDELTWLMGGAQAKLAVSPKPPTVYMLVGLQGAGKTTMAAKLGGSLKKQGKKVMLVGCDVYRPAAIKQLQVVGEQMGLKVYADFDTKDPVKIATDAVRSCDTSLYDTVIVDTAGRLHIDENLMEELSRIKAEVRPTEILLVVDAMTGQDAVTVAGSFDDQLGIDGIIMTKLDGDTRGGAALSVRAATGKNIKYVGVGEKLTDLEPFYPDRMASRILGMGDMLSLIDKAQAAIDDKKAAELEQKLRSQRFDLNDYLGQLDQMKNMGPLENVLGMLPGVNAKALKNVKVDDRQLDRIRAIITSMTNEEREHPEIINSSRKRRIAAGSGVQIQDVNNLLRQFEQMQKMIKMFSDPKKMRRMKLPF